MNQVIILFSMIFLHIVDDFYLQGILAQMKQRNWWSGAKAKYRYDYIVALLTHAFSWTYMIHLPLLIAYRSSIPISMFLFGFAANWLHHAFIDNLKANKLKINLITDQSLHIMQILETWILYMIMC